MEQQHMALSSTRHYRVGTNNKGGSTFNRIRCPQRRVAMLVLRDPQELKRINDAGIRSLVRERFTQIAGVERYDWRRHGYMIVLEPGDSTEGLERESGCPVLHDVFDELAFGDLYYQTIQDRNYVLASQPLANLDCQCLAAEDINDRQSSKPRSIGQLIGDEVQTPYFI